MKKSEVWFLVGIGLTFLVAISKSFFGDYLSLTDNFYKSCILFIIGYLITEKFSSFFASREIDSKLEALKNKPPFIFPVPAETTYMGDAKDGIRYLDNALKEAIAVRNTFFMHLTPKQRTLIHDYTVAESEAIIRNVTEFVKNGNEWTDIFSLTGGQERLQQLKKAFRENNIDLNILIKKYHCCMIKNNLPLINFIIIEYDKSKNKEALFGWGLHEAQPKGKVFSTRNLDIIDYFDKYFDSLSQAAENQDIKKLMGS